MEDNLYCYTPGEMAALIGGDATPGSKAAFEKHILKCAACRREWIEVSLAHALPVEQPPREVQEAIKAAPLIQRRARRAPVSERTYTGARVAALIAACAFVAVVLALVSSSPTPEVTPVTPAPFADKTPATPPESQQVEPEEQLALPVKKEVEKKVESMPLPEPEEEVVVVERREPEAPEVTAVPEPQEKLVQKPDVEQVPEKPACTGKG